MIDPIAFSIFNLDVYWYGIFYVIAFAFGYWFLMKFGQKSGFKKDFLEDTFFWFLIISVLGGRLFHVIFYEPSYYFNNIGEIIRLDKGGMSIHGGIFFGALFLWYQSRKFNVNFFKLTDLFVIPAAFGTAIGRVANAINQELVGKVTNNSFGLVFNSVDDNLRHPSMLYDSVKNMFTFQILSFMYFFQNLKPGVLTVWFLLLFNGLRLITEFFKEEAILFFGFITMGHLISLSFVIFAIWLYYAKVK